MKVIRTKTLAPLLSILFVCSTMLVVVGTANAVRPAASSQPFVTIGIITPGAPMNIYNSAGITFEGIDNMPLGYFKFGPNQNAFFPALASHWKQTDHGRKAIVYLRSNDRWSTGKAITAHDLYVTAALRFVMGYAQPQGLGSVKIVNSHEVIYNEASSGTNNEFLHSMLVQTIASAAVFQHLLPKNIWTVIHQSQYTGKKASLVTKQKAAAKTLTALGTKVSAYAPPHDVSSGPYVLSSINSGEAIYTKNKYFYAAKKIRVNELILRNYANNQQIWNYMIGGQVYQATSGGMSLDLVKQIKRTRGNVFYQVPSDVSAMLIFDEATYPYGITQVRQALSYLVNRRDVQRVGEPTGGSRSVWTDGLIDSVTKQWFLPSMRSKLNTYAANPAKATQLLDSVGFKKVGDKWMLPNGQPWTITINSVSGFSDWISAGQIMASELSAFGIPTQSQLVSSYSQYLTELADQKIPVGFWIGSLGSNPYGNFNRLYGTNDGYTLTGGTLTYVPPSNKTGGNWLAFPQTVKMSGYGNVNVGALTNRLASVTKVKQEAKIVQELALTTNYYVPEITLWNYVQAGFINDKYFTDFPLKNKAVMQAASGDYPPVGTWEVLGYIKPR